MCNVQSRWINGYSGRTGQMALKSASCSQKRWLWDLLGSPSWNPCKHFWLYCMGMCCVCVRKKECMFAWGILCQFAAYHIKYIWKHFVFYTLRVFSVNQFAKSVAKWFWCSDAIHELIFMSGRRRGDSRPWSDRRHDDSRPWSDVHYLYSVICNRIRHNCCCFWLIIQIMYSPANRVFSFSKCSAGGTIMIMCTKLYIMCTWSGWYHLRLRERKNPVCRTIHYLDN